MDTMVIAGVVLLAIFGPYMLAYGWVRLSRRVAESNLRRDTWEWDAMQAADVRDRIRHNVRNQG
jgi:hypothetical protein